MPLKVGVFGRLVTLSAPLQNGDRVEMYRALTVDPKEARRRRVKIKNTIKSNT
jgi:putative ubiquitin-RnfH superfamily antitoxin RatB of RatAB toxin-antitoxin module